MVSFHLANISQFLDIKNFYWQLIDEMQSSPYLPGWKKDIYPDDDLLKQAIEENQLYVIEKDHDIISAMILNHECNEGYLETDWQVQANNDETMYIHILAVAPKYQGSGYAKRMLKEAIKLARGDHMKAIRLDVLARNLPAIKLYEAYGFVFIRQLQMFYEDTGQADFLLYELVL